MTEARHVAFASNFLRSACFFAFRHPSTASNLFETAIPIFILVGFFGMKAMASFSTLESLLPEGNRRLCFLVPHAIKRALAKLLLHEDRPFRFLNIDIFGSCNLRCPSCPVGNMGQINPSGLMDLKLFERIAKKADQQHRVTGIGLFNWAEPMLHPQLPEFIRITKRHKTDCHISSNLNVMRHHEEVLAANPDHFRISLSGFTQATYGTTHV
jgi:hypothetical protein